MTFIVTVYVREGIVMASDSRLSLDSTRQAGPQTTITLGIAQSDASYKTYLTPNGVGISTFGAADIQGVPIAGYIQSFIAEQIREGDPVANVPSLLLAYFAALPGPPNVFFHVAGYAPDAHGHQEQFVWRVNVTARSSTRTNPPRLDGSPIQGASWDGESDVLSRLVQHATIFSAAGAQTDDFPAAEIPWQFFTLQDALDFAVYAVRTTIDTIRFQVRRQTVGGPIDVLVIRPTGATWVQGKVLHA